MSNKQAVRVATRYATAPLQVPRAPPSRRNVAVLSHDEYAPTLTADKTANEMTKLRCFNLGYSSRTLQNEKVLGEMQTLCASGRQAEPKIFTVPQTPISVDVLLST